MATKEPVKACAGCTRASHARSCAEHGCLTEILSTALSIEEIADDLLLVGVQAYRHSPTERIYAFARKEVTDMKAELLRAVHAACPEAARCALRAWVKLEAVKQGLDVLYAEVTATDDSLWQAVDKMAFLISSSLGMYDVSGNLSLAEELEEQWDAVVLELREQWGIEVPYLLSEKEEEILADMEARL